MRKSAVNLWKEDRGGVAVGFAIASILIFAICGACLDYSRAYLERTKISAAADAAALAYLQVYMNAGDEKKAKSDSLVLFKENSDGAEYKNLKIGPLQQINNALVVNVSADSKINSTFLRFFGNESIDVTARAEARVGIRSISAMVVPDVSWSMQGQHIEAVRNAIVRFGSSIYDLPMIFRSKLQLGLVPYAGSVNIKHASSKAFDLVAGWEYGSPENRSDNSRQYYDASIQCGSNGRRHVETPIPGNSKKLAKRRYEWAEVTVSSSGTSAPQKVWQCVDRGIVEQVNWTGCIQNVQAEFNSSNVLGYGSVPPIPPTIHQDSGFPHCPPDRSAMTVKSNSEGQFKSKAAKLELGFSTAHDIGLLWAMRAMEPAWSNFFNLPSRSWNDPKYPKFLILLSDGKSSPIKYDFGDYSQRSESRIDENTELMCQYLKDRGVTIYGISYTREGHPEAVQNVRNCASDDLHFHANQTNVNDVLAELASRIKSDGIFLSR